MKKSIETRTLESTIAGALFFLLLFVQNIILVPLFLKYWGSEKYGIWITIFAFSSLLKTIDLGHQNYVGNEFNIAFFKSKDQAKEILGSAFYIAILLGFLELLVYIFFAWGIKGSNINGLSNSITLNLELRYSLFLFILIWGVSGSLGGLLIRIIYPLGLYAKTVFYSLIYKIAEILILLSSIIFNWSLAELCLFYALITAIYNTLIFYYVKNVMPDFFPWWQRANLKLGFLNLFKSITLTINGFIEQFNSSGIILLISKVIGIFAIPIFTTIRTLTNIVLHITNLVTNPLIPDIIRFHTKGEKNKLNLIFDTNWFIAGLLVNLPFLIVAPFIQLFYKLWVKNNLQFNFNLYILLTLSVAFINTGRSYMEYLSSINSVRSMMIITISRVLLTIGIGFFITPILGLIGIGISILIAEIICSFVLPILFATFELDGNYRYKYNLFQLLGFGQILILIIFYLIIYNSSRTMYTNYFFYLLSIISMLSLSYLQWRNLDSNVKNRLKNLIKNTFNKYKFLNYFKNKI